MFFLCFYFQSSVPWYVCSWRRTVSIEREFGKTGGCKTEKEKQRRDENDGKTQEGRQEAFLSIYLFFAFAPQCSLFNIHYFLVCRFEYIEFFCFFLIFTFLHTVSSSSCDFCICFYLILFKHAVCGINFFLLPDLPWTHSADFYAIIIIIYSDWLSDLSQSIKQIK